MLYDTGEKTRQDRCHLLGSVHNEMPSLVMRAASETDSAGFSRDVRISRGRTVEE
jgi:hypothetical protein